MAREKFYIDFISDGTGRLYIDEPIGFNTMSFDVMQKDKGYGRDIFFNSGEAMMEFTNFRNHYLDKLLYYNHYYGFESKAKLGIEFINGESVIMDMDFSTAISDDLEYFKCKCVEVSEVQIVKRRASVKVDLFSNLDIDGNTITPVMTSNILLKPKSIIQTSKWDQVAYNNVYSRAQGAKTTNYDYVNPCANIIQSDLADTVSFFEINSNSPHDFYILEAKDNLTDINIKIEGLNLAFNTDVDTGGDGYVDMQFIVGWGDQNASLQVGDTLFHFEKYKTLLATYKTENQSYSYNSLTQGDFNINIDSLKRGDRIHVLFVFKIRQSSDIPGSRFEVFTTIEGMKTTISALTKSYYSTTKGIRLIDAVRQVSKSISGLNVNAPVIDSGSQYYDTFLFNGNLLRGIVDKPFYLSLDDLSNSLSTEINGDFETNENLFFGKEEDFYTNNEIWFFDNTQFSGFNKKTNDRFAINEFSYFYKNFQSQKENDASNSYDIIHGQSKMTFFNKMVENKKEISIEWVRDAFMIEEERRKSLEIDDQTATQNSDTIFALDTIVNTTDTIIKETSLLYHEYKELNGNLILRSKGEPNFKTLGISINDNFQIFAPDNNAGNYGIVTIENNSIELQPRILLAFPPQKAIPAGKPNANNNGERYTTYQYILNHIKYPLRNRTNEGFSNINGLNGAESYSNLRYSKKRNIVNNYQSYLATCNSYWNKTLKTTWYQNNRDFTSTYSGLMTKEGEDFLPEKPILSPWLYENAIFANVDFSDFAIIRNKLKSKRGFIRCIDKTGNVIKLYPKKMSYENLSKELNITGEAKFEPQKMSILTDNDNFITINDEVVIKTLIWEIIDHKVYIFDSNRQRLFNGVFWNNVAINGAFAKSEKELTELLNLL